MKIAIIPAAGTATRFKELGKQYAKTVLPYKGVPIIVHIVQQLKEAVKPDLIRIVYLKEDHKEQIEQALSLYNLSAEFVEVLGGRQGPGKSIFSGIPEWVTDNDSLYVHLSDFVASDASVLNIGEDAIATFTVDSPSRWCMAFSDADDNITRFVDKPKYEVDTNQAVAGLYTFSNARAFYDIAHSIPDATPGEYNISEIMTRYRWRIPLKMHRIEESSLIDFGTIEEYIKNRGISKTRSFNTIVEHEHSVEKSSVAYGQKVLDEAAWMMNAPENMEHYTPRVFSVNPAKNSFRMEKIKSTNLRDLYLYLDRSEQTWDELFDCTYSFLNSCRETVRPSTTFWEKILDKTIQRAEDGGNFEEHKQFFINFTYAVRSSRFYNETSYYHGDLHFSNMFYCFTYKDLKLIDPRGGNEGHWFYDLAKLNHSVYGKYDWIDAQLYSDAGIIYDRGTEGVQASFNKMLKRLELSEADLNFLNMLTASLFISMIPLHTHSAKNQELFLKQFLRFAKSPPKY